MKKYQIVEVTEKFNHAGTKATADVTQVAKELGFEEIYIHMNSLKKNSFAKVQRQIGYFFDWSKCYNQIETNAIVLLQHPFHYKQFTRNSILTKLKKEKDVKIISVVHDVEELRGFRYNDYYKSEFNKMLEIAEVLIVHNHVMLDWFVQRGVNRNRLINLQIFDYLQKDISVKKTIFDRSITIAGNLDTEKCGYIRQLAQLKDLDVILYGSNFDESMSSFTNIHYKGSFPVDDIPQKLSKGFGLVWDGNSIDGCLGESGQYLKYNNPHKMSLYLSSGIPVVIWSGAAEADFIRKNNVGICVDNLSQLEKIMASFTKEDYRKIVENVKIIQKKLVQGEYIRASLVKACKTIFEK